MRFIALLIWIMGMLTTEEFFNLYPGGFDAALEEAGFATASAVELAIHFFS